jgi:hypothetical protein
VFQSNGASAMSPCEASTPTGLCGRPYIEHGPVLQVQGTVAVSASSNLITVPATSMAPTSSAWSHPTNTVFSSANAARVDHYTAARDAGIPSGPFSNSPSARRTRAQGRSNPRGFAQVTPALATSTSAVATFLMLRIMFLPFAVHFYVILCVFLC